MAELKEATMPKDEETIERSSSGDEEARSIRFVDDEEGTPDRALYDAIIDDDLEATRRALEIGGNPNRYYIDCTISHLAESRAMITLLHTHGAAVHKAKMSNPARGLFVGLSGDMYDNPSHGSPLDSITKDQFDSGRSRRFGVSNPEKMNVPFWNAMVEARFQAWDARKKFLKKQTEVADEEIPSSDEEKSDDCGTEDKSAELEQGGSGQDGHSADKDEQTKTTCEHAEQQGPDENQDQDQNQNQSQDQDAEALEPTPWYSPIWCIDRWGHSLTTLPDGTHVQIGGEHEDGYDPDFLIYNDVIVHHATSTPENPQYDIYGYPEDVFRPTDSHSATFVPAQRAIFIIGCNGYGTADTEDMQKRGETPIYKLSIDNWAIEKVNAKGQSPGWIWQHDAELVGDAIRITDNQDGEDYLRAKRYVIENGERKMENMGKDEEWIFDINALAWRGPATVPHRAGVSEGP